MKLSQQFLHIQDLDLQIHIYQLMNPHQPQCIWGLQAWKFCMQQASSPYYMTNHL